MQNMNLPKLMQAAFRNVDGASSVFFRVAFGLLMASWAWDYLSLGIVTRIYVEPKFHFTYYLFDWLKPWSGNGMYAHFLTLCLLACFIASGFLYRVSALLFAVGFTYVFLLDRTNYQNHYYLIALISWWLPWLPLNRNVSVDAWLWPNIRSQTIPNWTLWVLRFHIGVPYFFGGIAKLIPDWMLGEPLSQMLASKSSLPFIGPVLAIESMGVLLAWGGLLFDLSIVPMLMWKRTRVIAYIMCIAFHLMNSVIFNIHVFPWFMLAATPLFFEPDWPRRVLGGATLGLPAEDNAGVELGFGRKLAVGFVLCYAMFHCVWPLRHNLYAGDSSWTERGHYFSWRMMLRGKAVVLGFAVKDHVTGKVVDGNMNRFIGSEQSEKFGRDPEMILHFAHFIGEEYRKSSGNTASVHALVLASLNGRKPELMIDPNVDLMQEPRGFHNRDWIMPQTEPLRRPAWNLPPDQWRQNVELPDLKFLTQSNPSTSQQVATTSERLAEVN
jgi:vitamin K-dependent gamma-carboxylase